MEHFSKDSSYSMWRSLQALNAARIIVAASLLMLFSFRNRENWQGDLELAQDLCLIYLLVAVIFFLFKVVYRHRFLLHLGVQIVVDITLISSLVFITGGSKSGFAVLYLMPLAGAAILSPMLWALFFTSLVVFAILAIAIYFSLSADDASGLTQAGIYGFSFFGIVYVVNRLAANLLSQEALALRRGRELALHQEINHLVINDMGDGILVLDQKDRVVTLNPSAIRLLSGQVSLAMQGLPLTEITILRPITEALSSLRQHSGFNESPGREEISFVSIRSIADSTLPVMSELITAPSQKSSHSDNQLVTHLKLRFVPVLGGLSAGMPGTYTIIFMQDVSDMENQAQQLKLASMGRLTASIAHEVRNPLSSISYANSLLSEDLQSGQGNQQQTERLLKIISDNVARLNQLIEDILKLSRKAQPDVRPYSVLGFLHDLLADFIETRRLAIDLIELEKNCDFQIQFDPSHLREVVTNLLSNAIRYASGKPGSVRLIPQVTLTGRYELHIQDDGAPIPYEVRAHLFEPFYTTSRMGTGLGLYMARELCLNNHSLLDYEYRGEEKADGKFESTGRFVINFSGYKAVL